jgi:hypothetical protein
MSHVVADTSFYLLFYADIGDKESLHHLLRQFEMHAGERLRSELKKHIVDDPVFDQSVHNVSNDVDFVRILKSFYSFLHEQFPEYANWLVDGEFEAMGISYHLNRRGILRYLVMDDKDARSFVEGQLATLRSVLVRTPIFLYKAHKVDKKLGRKFVVEILENIRTAIARGKSPLNLDFEAWEKYIKPLIDSMNLGTSD